MRFLGTLVFLFLANVAYLQGDLESKLFDLGGVSFEEIDCAKGFLASYKLMVKQPIDHNDHSKGYFRQKVYLNHRGFDSVTVQVTEGYTRRSNRIYEVADYLYANQVTVEHRYFGDSQPDSLDYRFLNFEQVAKDHHRINQLMKEIYKGKFIATGISKGGTTTIFYRYFYPKDVDVSIPYVAPLNRELEEKRIYHFLDTVGTDECRSNVLAFQKRILNNRDYVLDRFKWFAKGRNLKFDYLSLEQAFEYAVLEYPFSLWQWGTDCSTVPTGFSTIDEDMDHLLNVSGLDFFSDGSMEAYASHYFQSGEEMGYYGYETKDFKGLLPALGDKDNPSAVFAPNKMNVEWNGTLTNKVCDWVENHGNQFVYINGLNDTWSATRVPVSNKVDALWINMAGESHGTARIANMTKAQKIRLQRALRRWLK